MTSSPVSSATGPSSSDLLGSVRRIDARLARLEAALSPLTQLLERAPDVVATAGDIVDERAADLGDVEDRLQALLPLLEHATRPQTVRNLSAALELLDGLPDAVATGANIVDDAMDRAGREGLALDRVGSDVGELLFELLGLLPRLRELLGSGLFDPRTVRTLGIIGRAIAEASDEEPPKVGALGVFRAMRRADLGRAVGFALHIGSAVGRSLKRADKRLTTNGNER